MYAPAFKIVSNSSQTVNPQISLLFSPARLETLKKEVWQNAECCCACMAVGYLQTGNAACSDAVRINVSATINAADKCYLSAWKRGAVGLVSGAERQSLGSAA